MADAAVEVPEQVIQLYKVLKDQGFDVEEPGVDLIWLTFDRFSYAIMVDIEDPNYYHLLFPIGFEDKDKKLEQRLEAINTANALCKLAKAYLDEDGDLNIVVEVLETSPEEFVAKVPRYISTIQTSITQIQNKLGE